MNQHTENWIFLGDSLTEGVGSSRVSHVHELAMLLRQNGAANRKAQVNELRLREVNPDTFDRFVQFNVAGYLNVETVDQLDAIWIWNLASEGQTIENDFKWLPLIATLKPTLVAIFRGSLESIIRPAVLQDGTWPGWVPQSWRGYAAMDPRCYYSSTPWRKLKQVTMDRAKQYTRKRLLRREGKPLMELDRFLEYYEQLVTELQRLNTRIVILGLLPPGEEHFPKSPAYFETINLKLRYLAQACGAEFCDWAAQLRTNGYKTLFYRDAFHPNEEGAKKLALILQSHLDQGLNA